MSFGYQPHFHITPWWAHMMTAGGKKLCPNPLRSNYLSHAFLVCFDTIQPDIASFYVYFSYRGGQTHMPPFEFSSLKN